jgi:uncharacterized phage-associated protein
MPIFVKYFIANLSHSMESPFSIANFFIRKSFDTGVELTPMKLIKLVYLAHGWHLGLTKSPLLNEPVLAWRYGPVIDSLYQYFKHFGTQQITSFAYDRDKAQYQISDSDNIIPMLDRIWEVYHSYNGIQLSALTHQNGSPWAQIWNDNMQSSTNKIIPNQLIQKYYEQQVHGKAAAA